MELLGLLLVLGLIAALILPWVNMARIGGVRQELERLQQELSELRDGRDVANGGKSRVVAPKTNPAKEDLSKTEANKSPVAAMGANRAAAESVAEATPIRQAQGRQESCDPGDAALERGTAVQGRPIRQAQGRLESGVHGGGVQPPPLEGKAVVKQSRVAEIAEPAERQDWFSKVAIWVGSIALLMAGFYMIKYSIDEGLLTPAVRVWLTTGFGLLLCAVGFVIGVKSVQLANGRIGQALSGAGVACSYFAAYAAVHLYDFLTPGQGFAAMLAVTVLAVVLSLKNGAPVAMLGLVGGFLTPWLMNTGSNDTVMLFSYLFLLFCGAQFLCLRRGWWALLLGSLVGAYLWSAVVIVGNLSGALNNLEGTLVFVLGICLVNAAWVLLAKADTLDENATRLLAGVRWLTWCGGLVQALVLVLIGGFAAVDMLLFSLLSVGALALAVLREDEFIWAAWLALAAVFAGALSNAEASLWSWLLLPLGLGGLFFGVGHWRGLHSERILGWRSLSVVAAFFVVPLLYLNREWVQAAASVPGSSGWLWMSLAGALLLALAGEHIFRREADAKVAGEYSLFALVLAGFGLWTFVPEAYYAHAAALLLMLAAWYWRWREFGRSEIMVSLCAAAWAGSMALHAAEAIHYFFGETMYDAPGQDGLAVLGWALGVGAAATVFVAYRKAWSESAVQTVAWVLGLVSLLGFVAIYQWLNQTYMPADWSSMSVEGGLTSLLALAAVVFALLTGKRYGFRFASLALAILAGVRIVYLHLFDAGAEGESFFFNALLLQFGVPFSAACLLAVKSGHLGDERWRRVYQVSAMLLGFVWVTFLVQDYFGGSTLLDQENSSTEIYTYSVVWLLLAIVYQAIGLLRNQPAIHVGSLLLLLVTIGKVFLVDAAELEGLFRVLSFLGLGLALIAIGFFYNKVVFTRKDKLLS